MKRWLGPDLNGWHDFAARDWPPEEPDALARKSHTEGCIGALNLR